jgi:hypothetical protein
MQKPFDMLYPLMYIASMKRDIPKAVREYMASIGSIGGKATNCGKGLNSEQARVAALARWNKPGARKSEQKVKT